MEQLEQLCPVHGNENGVAYVNNSMEAPQKLKMEPSYDPAFSLLGIYLKVLKLLKCDSQRDPGFRYSW